MKEGGEEEDDDFDFDTFNKKHGIDDEQKQTKEENQREQNNDMNTEALTNKHL